MPLCRFCLAQGDAETPEDVMTAREDARDDLPQLNPGETCSRCGHTHATATDASTPEDRDADPVKQPVEMDMLFVQHVRVALPMYEIPATPEDALDAYWSVHPTTLREAITPADRSLWTCVDVTVPNEGEDEDEDEVADR